MVSEWLLWRPTEQVELTAPRGVLEAIGARVLIVSPEDNVVRAWQHTDWGDSFAVDVPLDEARAGDFDALLLPGGVMNPDRLRTIPEAIALIKEFFEQGKPIGAICHGPWALIEAGVAAGRRITSYPSLATDLRNAGATWVDQDVVVDAGIVTSRTPEDLPAFTHKLVLAIQTGAQERPLEVTSFSAQFETADGAPR